MDYPSYESPERETIILDCVAKGHYEVEWAPITSTANGHTAEFQVFADAMKIDGVRVNISAETEQKIADMTGCMLLTPKLADLIFLQRAITIPPFPQPITASTAAMLGHSKKIDDALAKFGYTTGIVATTGKNWCLDNAMLANPGRAVNYGWHFEGYNFQGIVGAPCVTMSKDSLGRVVRVIQNNATAHNPLHADYSQVCCLVSEGCIVDGQPMALIDVLTNPDLAPLASHQGVLKVFRQPGVPAPTQKVICLPEVKITSLNVWEKLSSDEHLV